ncbi:hypothetical protein FB441_3723 [Vibrio crassostreae]|nr:hypothetical protein FB441_3723 [Vibrio crassostreae]
MLRFNETRKLTTHNRSVPSSNLGGATKLEKPEQFMLLWLFAFLNLYNLRPAFPNQ